MNRVLDQCLLAVLVIATAQTCGAAELNAINPDITSKIEAALPDRDSAQSDQPRKVLLFSKTNGFRHGSIPVGVAALKMLGERTGAYVAEHTEDESMFEPETLKQFDAVVFVNTTGPVFLPKSLPSDAAEREAVIERENRLKGSLVDFVKSGKGLAGVHSATDTYQQWKEFNDMMGGAFVGHPWHAEVPVRLLDSQHPLNQVFGGEGFTIVDEIYQFRDDTALRSERRMLLSLDPNWEGLSKGSRKDGFYPISWIDTYGDGRTFYCSLGHRDEIYYNPSVLRHYLAGFRYALGDLAADATPDDGKDGD